MMLSLPASAAWILLVVAAPVSLWVIWSDMRAMRIPNAAVLTLMAGYAGLGLIALPLTGWAIGWAQFAVVLVLGFLLNVAGAVGAGDAKFAAAMAPFIAFADAALFVMLFSLVLLAAFATHRGVRAVPALRGLSPDWRSWQRRDFPMGFALGGALLLYLLLAALQGR
jgi:prepilin peptidase CpaA